MRTEINKTLSIDTVKVGIALINNTEQALNVIIIDHKELEAIIKAYNKEFVRDFQIIEGSEYKALLADSKKLEQLHAAGVDNWEGYHNG